MDKGTRTFMIDMATRAAILVAALALVIVCKTISDREHEETNPVLGVLESADTMQWPDLTSFRPVGNRMLVRWKATRSTGAHQQTDGAYALLDPLTLETDTLALACRSCGPSGRGSATPTIVCTRTTRDAERLETIVFFDLDGNTIMTRQCDTASDNRLACGPESTSPGASYLFRSRISDARQFLVLDRSGNVLLDTPPPPAGNASFYYAFNDSLLMAYPPQPQNEPWWPSQPVLRFINVRSGQLAGQITLPSPHAVRDMQFVATAPHGNAMAICSRGDVLCLIDSTLSVAWSKRLHFAIGDLTFSPDARFLATLAQDREPVLFIILVDAASGKVLWEEPTTDALPLFYMFGNDFYFAGDILRFAGDNNVHLFKIDSVSGAILASCEMKDKSHLLSVDGQMVSVSKSSRNEGALIIRRWSEN